MAVMFHLHASACDNIEECYSWGLCFVDLEYAPMSPGIDAKVSCGDGLPISFSSAEIAFPTNGAVPSSCFIFLECVPALSLNQPL